MSFWAGFAQAYKDADEQRFKEKLLADERAYETQQQAEARKFEQSEFDRRFAIQQAAAERELFLSTALQGGLTGTGRRGSGGGASAEDQMSFEAFVTANPELDDEGLARLASYPDKLYELNDILTKARTNAAEKGQVITPEQFNSFIVDIIPEDPLGEITAESIQERAAMFGIDLGGMNLDVVAEALNNQPGVGPEVVTNPSAITPTDPAVEKQLRDTISGELLGTLQDQLRVARSNQNMEEVDRLNQLIAVAESGNLRPVLNTPEGTGLILEYLQSGYDVDIKRVFPGFMPTFSNEDQIAAALSAGLIDYGSRIRFLQPDGTFKEVVVRQ